MRSSATTIRCRTGHSTGDTIALGTPTFTPYLEIAGLDDYGLQVVRVSAFVGAGRSTRRLDGLRTAIDRLDPAGALSRKTARQAIRIKRSRSRIFHHRSPEAIGADPVMAPHESLQAFDGVPLEDLRVLSGFPASPGREALPLRRLEAALGLLLPDNPAAHILLAAASR